MKISPISSTLLPEVRPPVIRSSLDGTDILITMGRDTMLANPAYVLAMRLIGCRSLSWRSFLKCAHWMALVPLGGCLGASVFFGTPDWTPLAAVPIAFVYFVYVMQTHGRITLELQKRGLILDLFLVPHFDPLEFGAGLALAARYELRRVGAACLAFIAAATIPGGVLAPGSRGATYVAVGSLCAFVGLALAQSVAAPSAKARIMTSYREINEQIKTLRNPYQSYMPRSLALWLGALAVAAICVFSIRHWRHPVIQMGSMLAAVAAFLVYTRFNQERAPGPDKARNQIYAALRNCL